MGMMIGFGELRRRELHEELARIAGELPSLGARGSVLLNDILSDGTVGPETELDLLVVLETDEPFHRRGDFLTSHLRPGVGVRFLVYTPDELMRLRNTDRILRWGMQVGHMIDELQ